MAGNKAGGAQARDTNIQRYGDNYYQVIGGMGGRKSTGGGFAANHVLAREAGRIGGLISKRGGYQWARTPAAQREIKAAYQHLLKVHTLANDRRMQELLSGNA